MEPTDTHDWPKDAAGKRTDPIGRWLEALSLEDQRALARAAVCSVDWNREMRRICCESKGTG